MSMEKYKQLIDELIKNTETGRLEWKKTAEPGTFQISFPKYSIMLSQGNISGKNPLLPMYSVHLIRILNAEGRGVDLFSDDDLGDEYQDKVAILYQHAQRQALGAEKALDEILNALRNAR